MGEKPEKPWSVDQFEEYRSYMTTFVREKMVPIINNHNSTNVKRLLLHGDVKVGKREVVEYLAVRDSINENRQHIFLSSFHRKADEPQREELESHGLLVFSIYSAKMLNSTILFISELLDQNELLTLIIHWDECDYGTGDKQNLSDIYKIYRNNNRVFNILYSATPEELLYSSEITKENNVLTDFYEDGIVLKYIPPEGYCGAQTFLDHNLVHQALPFFEINRYGIVLSDQAKDILKGALKEMKSSNRKIRNLQDRIEDAEEEGDLTQVSLLKREQRTIHVRNIISLRISYCVNDEDDDDDGGDRSELKTKAIYHFLQHSHSVEELKDVYIIADKPDISNTTSFSNVKSETVQWSKKLYWNLIPKDKLVIIVNDQTSTRSTEWVCHHRMYATHDFRKRITYNTVSQAQLRPSHYEQNYGGFQPIHIYGDLKTFQFTVNLITVTQYLNSEWIRKKISKSDPPMYRIKNVNDTKTNKKQLPEITITHDDQLITISNGEGYSSEVSLKILTYLGCTASGKTKMSQRVKGNSKKVPIIYSKFYPCEPTDVESVLIILNEDEELVEGCIANRSGMYPISQYLNDHKFKQSNLFSKIDEEGRYQGNLRGYKMIDYDFLKSQHWGIRLGYEEIRLTECYKDGVLGLGLRFATGDTRETDSLEAWKSMYQI
jgi:hypothetical protein